MKNPYKQIASQVDIHSLLNWVGDFHDGLIKEIHVVNSGFVDTNLAMTEPGSGVSARILVQCQFRYPFAVELVFLQVLRIDIREMRDIRSASASFSTEKETGFPRIIFDFDGDQIESRALLYRDASTWMGKEARFGEYLAGDGIAGFAQPMGEGFFMCPECTHVWKPLSPHPLTGCPQCDVTLIIEEQESVQQFREADARRHVVLFYSSFLAARRLGLLLGHHKYASLVVTSQVS
jgi:hypothetical protein